MASINNIDTSVVDYLKNIGKDSSYSARSKTYSDSPLLNRLGDYVGSSQQNTALLNYLKNQNTPTITPTSTSYPYTPLSQLPMNLPSSTPQTPTTTYQQPTTTYQQPTATYYRNPNGMDVYDAQGNHITAEQAALIPNFWSMVGMSEDVPATNYGATGQVAPNALSPIESLIQSASGVAETPTTPTPTPTPSIPSALTSATTTAAGASEDWASILARIMTTPEMTLEQAKTMKERADEMSRLQSELSGTQRTYEQRGIPSSGLKEAEISAEEAVSASKQLGISQDLATIILRAIREEQQAQTTATEKQETARAKALESMGYVEIDGQFYPTLAREKQETGAGEVRQIGNTLVKVYDDGSVQVLYEGESTANADVKYFEDEAGNVTKIVTDPKTGAEISRESLGKIGSSTKWAGGGGEEEVLKTEQAVAGVRANIYSWLSTDAKRTGGKTREVLIEELVAEYGDELSREEVAREVYGITTPYEGRKGYKNLPKSEKIAVPTAGTTKLGPGF